MKKLEISDTYYISSGHLHIDLSLGRVSSRSGESLRLSPVNLKVLTYLLSRPGEVISRKILFDVVWPNQIVSDDVLTRAISDIRNQLARLDSDTQFIETLPKRGYRWNAEVSNDCPPTSRLAADDADINYMVSNQSSRVGTSLPATSTILRLAAGYCSLAILAAGILMWLLGALNERPLTKVVALPVKSQDIESDRYEKMVSSILIDALRHTGKLVLLSKEATDSRPANPFPYFFTEFGVKWVLESEISAKNDYHVIELSLVDARTGMEVRSQSIEYTSNADLRIKLAKVVGTTFLVNQTK